MYSRKAPRPSSLMQRNSTPAVRPIPEPFWEDVLVSGLDPIALDRRAAQVFDNTASIDGSVGSRHSFPKEKMS